MTTSANRYLQIDMLCFYNLSERSIRDTSSTQDGPPTSRPPPTMDLSYDDVIPEIKVRPMTKYTVIANRQLPDISQVILLIILSLMLGFTAPGTAGLTTTVRNSIPWPSLVSPAQSIPSNQSHTRFITSAKICTLASSLGECRSPVGGTIRLPRRTMVR
jgi:hypothetical protein